MDSKTKTWDIVQMVTDVKGHPVCVNKRPLKLKRTAAIEGRLQDQSVVWVLGTPCRHRDYGTDVTAGIHSPLEVWRELGLSVSSKMEKRKWSV